MSPGVPTTPSIALASQRDRATMRVVERARMTFPFLRPMYCSFEFGAVSQVHSQPPAFVHLGPALLGRAEEHSFSKLDSTFLCFASM